MRDTLKPLAIILTGLWFSACSLFDPGREPWDPVEQCIASVTVDYETEIVVSNEQDVRRVFEMFIASAQRDSIPIFGHTNNYRFEKAYPHGTYEGVRYWQVEASWYDDSVKRWRLEIVFDVSNGGDVVRLLGCI